MGISPDLCRKSYLVRRPCLRAPIGALVFRVCLAVLIVGLSAMSGSVATASASPAGTWSVTPTVTRSSNTTTTFPASATVTYNGYEDSSKNGGYVGLGADITAVFTPTLCGGGNCSYTMSSISGTLFGYASSDDSGSGVPCSVTITPSVEQYLPPYGGEAGLGLMTEYGGPSGNGSGGSIELDFFANGTPESPCFAGINVGNLYAPWNPGTKTSAWPLGPGNSGSVDITWNNPGDAVIDQTKTAIRCSPIAIAAGSQTTCTATVTDTSEATAPVGSVGFSASPDSGTFSSIGGLPSTTCKLDGAATCDLRFTPSKPGVYQIFGTYDPDTEDLSDSSGEAALAVTCSLAHGSFGQRLLTGLRCANDVLSAEAKCTAGVAALVLPFTKLKLAAYLRKDGLLDLRFFKSYPKLKSLARVYNELAGAKILPSAPVGYRTRKELWDKFSSAGDAWDFVKEQIPAFADALSPSDLQNFAIDLAKVAGLGSCLDFLVTHA